MKTFKKDDAVSWNSAGGKSVGKVIKKVTSTTKVKGFTAKASKEHPEYLVRSDKSSKTAIHIRKELRRV